MHTPFWMVLFTGTQFVNACIIKIFSLMKETLTHQFSFFLNPLNTNLTKCSNALKQFVGKLPTNYLNVFDHFVGLALKKLIASIESSCLLFYSWTFRRQSHKMVKYTQTIYRQFADDMFECVWPFCKIGVIPVHYYSALLQTIIFFTFVFQGF